DPLLPALKRFRFYINLQTRLGERKVMWTELDLGFRAKQFVHEKLERAFQIRDADVFIDIKTFDLVKLRAMRCVHFVATVRRAGRNHANRWRCGLHRADLNGRRMSSEQS